MEPFQEEAWSKYISAIIAAEQVVLPKVCRNGHCYKLILYPVLICGGPKESIRICTRLWADAQTRRHALGFPARGRGYDSRVCHHSTSSQAWFAHSLPSPHSVPPLPASPTPNLLTTSQWGNIATQPLTRRWGPMLTGRLLSGSRHSLRHLEPAVSVDQWWWTFWA